MFSMTKEDMMKFCERGSHEYGEAELVRTVGVEDFANFYDMFKCKVCPARFVKAR